MSRACLLNPSAVCNPVNDACVCTPPGEDHDAWQGMSVDERRAALQDRDLLGLAPTFFTLAMVPPLGSKA